MAAQTGSSYNSDCEIDMKTIPKATPRFPGLANPEALQSTTSLAFIHEISDMAAQTGSGYN
jgi:hypothetical protein